MERLRQIGIRVAAAALLLGAAACSEEAEPAPGGEADAGGGVEDAGRDPGSCEFDIDCSETPGNLCINGRCAPGICHPGEPSCLNNDVVRCNDDAQSYTAVEPCTGRVCVRGECRTRVCEPGSVTCAERARLVCNERGDGYATRPCFGDQVCFDGACVDPSCSPGKSLCLDDLTLGTCAANGGGYVGRLCGFALRCDPGGGCIPHHAVAFGDDGRLVASPVARPALGWLALWLVRDRDAAGAVELIAWEEAGLFAQIDLDAGALLLGPSPDALAPAYPLALQTGDVSHLVLAWDAEGAVTALLDGFALGPPLPGGVAPGGAPRGTLTLGRASEGATPWPGRVGSVHLGAGVLASGFAPRCDAPPADARLAAWTLDEGQGEEGFSRDADAPPLRLEGSAAWDGGLLGRYGADVDGDAYGDPERTLIACAPPLEGDLLRLGDCNDGSAAVSPAAEEIEDARDNDCDGAVDEAP